MASQSLRENFSEKTRQLVAERAGYRCSMPNCDRVTIGPGKTVDKSNRMGNAAHIYSASPGGPRGAGGLTPEELRSATNAIWLCETHASQVDKNRGSDYPAPLLISYKAVHEAKIARELQGDFTPLGWVTSLKVKSSPLFNTSTNIELGKLTLLIGKNDTGKTALCEWLAAATSPRFLERWQNTRKGQNYLDIEMAYLDPEPHTTRILFEPSDYPRYLHDDQFTPVTTASLKVIFPGELRFKYQDERDDLELIASTIGLSQCEIVALCEEILGRGTQYVTKAWFVEDEDQRFLLHADVAGTCPGLSFRQLSSSEQTRVLMEFSIVAAEHLATRFPTILILDAGVWSLDTGWLKMYGEALSSPALGFQTVASIPTRDLELDEIRWAGWKVVRLEGKPPDVTINSNVR